VIVSMLTLELQADRVRALGEVFARHRILHTAITVEGCRRLVLAAPDLDGDVAYVLGLWDDEAAYQRWIDHPERGAATADLLPLLAGDVDPSAPAQTWHVLQSVDEADTSVPPAAQ
jgi:heme-degrading monooxygenase HmoA